MANPNISPVNNAQLMKILGVLAQNLDFINIKYFLEHENELINLIKKYESKFTPDQIDVINKALAEINGYLVKDKVSNRATSTNPTNDTTYHGYNTHSNDNYATPTSHTYSVPVETTCTTDDVVETQDDSLIYLVLFILIVIAFISACLSRKSRYY